MPIKQRLPKSIPRADRFGIALVLLLGGATLAGYFMRAEQPVDAVRSVRYSAPSKEASLPDKSPAPPRTIVKPIVAEPVAAQSASPEEPEIHQDKNSMADAGRSTAVLHITNIGDRIVVSNDPRSAPAAAMPQSGTGHTTPVSPAASATIDRQIPLADYDEVYPGCPRALPQGADERMARQQQELYGCRYAQSCDLASEESAASCTWYLVGKS